MLVQQLNRQIVFQNLLAQAIVINFMHIPHLNHTDGVMVLDYIESMLCEHLQVIHYLDSKLFIIMVIVVFL